MAIRCEIVSQDRMVWEGDADIVNIPGSDGDMGILGNHAPLLSTLRPGIINVRQGGVDQFFTVSGGIIEVQPDIITVLADVAENVDEIDVARAEAAKARAEALMEEGLGADVATSMAVEAALRRSTLRLDAVQRYRRRRRATSSYQEEA